jgi:hypothetical protein
MCMRASCFACLSRFWLVSDHAPEQADSAATEELNSGVSKSAGDARRRQGVPRAHEGCMRGRERRAAPSQPPGPPVAPLRVRRGARRARNAAGAPRRRARAGAPLGTGAGRAKRRRSPSPSSPFRAVPDCSAFTALAAGRQRAGRPRRVVRVAWRRAARAPRTPKKVSEPASSGSRPEACDWRRAARPRPRRARRDARGAPGRHDTLARRAAAPARRAARAIHDTCACRLAAQFRLQAAPGARACAGALRRLTLRAPAAQQVNGGARHGHQGV